jgi:hypothetical protein
MSKQFRWVILEWLWNAWGLYRLFTQEYGVHPRSWQLRIKCDERVGVRGAHIIKRHIWVADCINSERYSKAFDNRMMAVGVSPR